MVNPMMFVDVRFSKGIEPNNDIGIAERKRPIMWKIHPPILKSVKLNMSLSFFVCAFIFIVFE